MKIGIAMFPTIDAPAPSAAHIGRSCGSPQDASGAISDSDTARFLDDVVANTTH